MKFVGIIPARYASTRFPGKPLIDLRGKPMIQRVYERVSELLDETVVATDDERIASAVVGFGGNAIMTSLHHRSGTDRCYEAYTQLKSSYDVVVNIQGDEPFIRPSQIELLKQCFLENETQIATLIQAFTPENTPEDLFNPNTPKVVVNARQQALYFSRSVIPYVREKPFSEWLQSHVFYKHIGIYAYKAEILKELITLSPSNLEKAESLEQLRWLENGYTITTRVTQEKTIGIDTPQDLERALLWLDANK
ncbi:MAG: 3-deoxy-manno-octulosonate cytidylyltransferase [Dysgonamonadaceae bacterium]|jgi:3-deoxy-manno-octulosonate cytidylyltransferase (CMP-KDO synthetase)|nr:3-deoxy-manno-octulosonate cytidylyltransferase [Dysgonamonadaceae bacterium]